MSDLAQVVVLFLRERERERERGGAFICLFVYLSFGWHYQVLKFDAYFKQTVSKSPQELYRIRCVSIYYYLEDDSIAVIEPLVENRWIDTCTSMHAQSL